MDQKLKDFFRDYEEAFRDLDFRRQAEHFSEHFVSAGPRGEIALDKEQFLAMAEKTTAFYRQVGMTGVRLTDAKETPITAEYTSVKTHWAATFRKTGDKQVEFDITYILHKGEKPKVVMFITHQDEEATMKELGYVPEEAHA